jgi:hypothetical protein
MEERIENNHKNQIKIHYISPNNLQFDYQNTQPHNYFNNHNYQHTPTGYSNGDTKINFDKRKSKTNIHHVNIKCNLNFENILFDGNWTNIKYEVGDFFNKHRDTKINSNHNETLLLIVPKSVSNYDGGVLNIYDPITDNLLNSVTCSMFNYILVSFPIHYPHEVSQITSGIRQIFKKPKLKDHQLEIIEIWTFV